jgi:iron complex outermembrane receptor protein
LPCRHQPSADRDPKRSRDAGKQCRLQIAAFASADFDIIPHILTVSAGTRYYDYSEYMVGSQYETYTYPSGGCLNVPDGQCVGDNVSFNASHNHQSYVGFKSKATITWNYSPNGLVYYLFSQGFRPGAFNRSSALVAPGADGVKQYDKPQVYAPDSLNNNEIGLKTQLFDHRLQVNLSAYYMNWNNTQYTIFDPGFTGNTAFSANGPSYTIKGMEFQVVGRVTQGLTIQTSGSYNDSKESKAPCLVDNNPKSSGYNNCITSVLSSSGSLTPFVSPFGTVGLTPAFSPTFKGNIRGVYVWSMPGDYKATTILGGNYTGSMYNEPGNYPSGDGVVTPNTTLLRYLQPAYTTADGSFSIAKDTWTATLYATNMFDSHASTYTSEVQFIKSEVPLRPRVIGVKLGARF